MAERVEGARQVLRKAPTSRGCLDLPEFAAASGLMQKDLIQSIKNIQQVHARPPGLGASRQTSDPLAPHHHSPPPSAARMSVAMAAECMVCWREG